MFFRILDDNLSYDKVNLRGAPFLLLKNINVKYNACFPFITEMAARTRSLVEVLTPLSSPIPRSASGAIPEEIVVND